MAAITPIGWCHSSVNPVMGCASCEIGPKTLIQAVRHPKAALVFADHGHPSTSKSHLELLARQLKGTDAGGAILRELQKCYACVLHRRYPGKPGYAADFFQPELFAGRMAEAARWSDVPSVAENLEKPWLAHMPRMIFISDMGDALSAGVPFQFLKDEIIDVVTSPKGRAKVWLWLTKRPERMADFAEWLDTTHGIAWPENLWAGTSITDRQSLPRAAAILKVPAKRRFISYEPCWEYVDLKPFLGPSLVSWLIVGGESGGKRKYCADFRMTDLQKIIADAEACGIDLFIKQLGASPVDATGNRVVLKDSHGADWYQWPEYVPTVRRV